MKIRIDEDENDYGGNYSVMQTHKIEYSMWDVIWEGERPYPLQHTVEYADDYFLNRIEIVLPRHIRSKRREGAKVHAKYDRSCGHTLCGTDVFTTYGGYWGGKYVYGAKRTAFTALKPKDVTCKHCRRLMG